MYIIILKYWVQALHKLRIDQDIYSVKIMVEKNIYGNCTQLWNHTIYLTVV